MACPDRRLWLCPRRGCRRLRRSQSLLLGIPAGAPLPSLSPSPMAASVKIGLACRLRCFAPRRRRQPALPQPGDGMLVVRRKRPFRSWRRSCRWLRRPRHTSPVSTLASITRRLGSSGHRRPSSRRRRSLRTLSRPPRLPPHPAVFPRRCPLRPALSPSLAMPRSSSVAPPPSRPRSSGRVRRTCVSTKRVPCPFCPARLSRSRSLAGATVVVECAEGGARPQERKHQARQRGSHISSCPRKVRRFGLENTLMYIARSWILRYSLAQKPQSSTVATKHQFEPRPQPILDVSHYRAPSVCTVCVRVIAPPC